MGCCGLHLGWVFLPQVSLSGNAPIDIPELCVLGNSKCSQADSENWPSLCSRMFM